MRYYGACDATTSHYDRRKKGRSCRATRRHFSAEDKIRIVLDGLRGDDSIADLCRKEDIAQSVHYVWSMEFLEAGKRRLSGDTVRAATTDESKVCAARPVR